MSLAGKVAFVSGASRGIGKAIALAFAQAGADVAINFNSHRDEAEEVAQLIHREGQRSFLCSCDVSDGKSVDKMLAEVAAEFGGLDIAIANAAYSHRELFYHADLNEVRRSVDVTMWGTFNVFRASAQQMIEQKRGGALVAISSPLAFVPIATSMPYNMAKAAVDQMSRTAALELAPHRIRVNIVHPGWIDTPGERKFVSEEQIQEAAKDLLWGRLGRADEIARGVVFLCDPASDYITGSSLLIDGGFTLPWWLNKKNSSDTP